MKLKTLIPAAVAALLAASASAADDEAKPASAGRTSLSAELFERLDRNKDGFVTRDEAKDATELQGRFAELDRDDDGRISRSEMRALDNERSAAGSSSRPSRRIPSPAAPTASRPAREKP